MQLLFDQVTRPGVRSRVWWDEVEGTYHNEHIGDVEANIEHAKRASNGDRKPKTGDGTFRHVAHIPPVIALQWLNDGIDVFSRDPDQQRKVKQRLQDPDWRFLRTDGGRRL
ncbi:MAG: hypothetical protein R3F54_28725 [Alphaproteobacteria bacterium]